MACVGCRGHAEDRSCYIGGTHYKHAQIRWNTNRPCWRSFGSCFWDNRLQFIRTIGYLLRILEKFHTLEILYSDVLLWTRIFLWNSKILRFIDMNNSLMYIIQITDLHRKCDLFFRIGQRKTNCYIKNGSHGLTTKKRTMLIPMLETMVWSLFVIMIKFRFLGKIILNVASWCRWISLMKHSQCSLLSVWIIGKAYKELSSV